MRVLIAGSSRADFSREQLSLGLADGLKLPGGSQIDWAVSSFEAQDVASWTVPITDVESLHAWLGSQMLADGGSGSTSVRPAFLPLPLLVEDLQDPFATYYKGEGWPRPAAITLQQAVSLPEQIAAHLLQAWAAGPPAPIYSATSLSLSGANGLLARINRHSPELAQVAQTAWSQVLKRGAGARRTLPFITSPSHPDPSQPRTPSAGITKYGAGAWGIGALLAQEGGVLQPVTSLLETQPSFSTHQTYDLVLTWTDALHSWNLPDSPLSFLVHQCERYGWPLFVFTSENTCSSRELRANGIEQAHVCQLTPDGLAQAAKRAFPAL